MGWRERWEADAKHISDAKYPLGVRDGADDMRQSVYYKDTHAIAM